MVNKILTDGYVNRKDEKEVKQRGKRCETDQKATDFFFLFGGDSRYLLGVLYPFLLNFCSPLSPHDIVASLLPLILPSSILYFSLSLVLFFSLMRMVPPFKTNSG
jgi:hypothetical protein